MNNFNATSQHQDSLSFMTPRHHMDYESHFDEQDEEIRMLNQEFREGRTPIFTKTGGRTEDRKKRLSDNDRVTARVPFLYHSESGKNRKVFECVLKETFGEIIMPKP